VSRSSTSRRHARSRAQAGWSGIRLERVGVLGLAGWAAGCVGCTALLDLDDYSVATDAGMSTIGELRPDAGALAPGVAVFDHYRFERGEPSFEVGAVEGLLANDTAAAVLAGSFPTRAGGGIEIAADGSFRYTPPGETGAFWGQDGVEYEVEGAARARARVRLTVAAGTFELRQLLGSGAGFGIAGAQLLDDIGAFAQGLDAAGDVNGDGFEDIVIGVPGPAAGLGSTPDPTSGRGACVVFGKSDTAPVSLAALDDDPPKGFAIARNGDDDLDSLGVNVAGVGDVNGDGLDDVVVSQDTFHGEGPFDEDTYEPIGASYVVFGKRDATPVDTTAIRAGQGGGFALLGSPTDRLVGYAVAAAGDVNGDGLADVMVSTPTRDQALDGLRGPGAAYVVFGRAGAEPVQLATLAQDGAGFEIRGELEAENFGTSVSGVGDINGDGLDDVAVSGTLYPSEAVARGRIGVVFGKRETSNVRLADLGDDATLGFILEGADDGDALHRLQLGGDINGDGLDDILIGAPLASLGSPVVIDRDAGSGDAGEDSSDAGATAALLRQGVAYVLYGSSSLVSMSLRELESPSAAGFAVGERTPGVTLGVSTASGDINGDGLSDALIGTEQGLLQGRAYAVLGAESTPTLTLPSPGEAGKVREIVGAVAEGAGRRVASGADVNADGFDELLFAASRYPNMAQNAGGVYVAFGWDIDDRLGERDRAVIGTSADNVLDLPLAPIVIARGGHGIDTLRVGPRPEPLDLRERGRYESIEVIDARGGGPQVILLDDAAVRRIPQNAPGFAFSLARRLAILGDAEDTLRFDMTAYTSRSGAAGRIVYAREGCYYGLEVSRELRIEAP